MPWGGEVILGFKRRGQKAIVFIKDTGIGIPTDLHNQLFKKLKQIQRAGTENESSSGLGHSITKQLTKELKGKLWIKSIENEGTTFTFCCQVATLRPKNKLSFGSLC